MNELFIVDLIRSLLKKKIEIDDLKVYKHNECEFIISINNNLIFYFKYELGYYFSDNTYYIEIYELNKNTFFILTQEESIEILSGLNKNNKFNEINYITYKQYKYSYKLDEMISIARKYLNENLVNLIYDPISFTIIVIEFYFESDIKRIVISTKAKNYNKYVRDYIFEQILPYFHLNYDKFRVDSAICYEVGLRDLLSRIKHSDLKYDPDHFIRYFYIFENCMYYELEDKCNEILSLASNGYFKNQKRIQYKRYLESKWKEEELLYKLVEKTFPNKQIFSQYTPSIYDGEKKKQVRFRYDVYIANYKIAIEYQGIQHFSPVEYFGGEEGFIKTQERDKYKYENSLKNDIDIIYVNYNDFIDSKILKEKVKIVLAAKEERKIQKYKEILLDKECKQIDDVFIENISLREIVLSKFDIENISKTFNFIKKESECDQVMYYYNVEKTLDINFVIYAQFYKGFYGLNEKKWGYLLYYILIKNLEYIKLDIERVIIKYNYNIFNKKTYITGITLMNDSNIDEVIYNSIRELDNLKYRYKLFKRAKKYFLNKKN